MRRNLINNREVARSPISGNGNYSFPGTKLAGGVTYVMGIVFNTDGTTYGVISELSYLNEFKSWLKFKMHEFFWKTGPEFLRNHLWNY
jgi:hypothetical protein